VRWLPASPFGTACFPFSLSTGWLIQESRTTTGATQALSEMICSTWNKPAEASSLWPSHVALYPPHIALDDPPSAATGRIASSAFGDAFQTAWSGFSEVYSRSGSRLAAVWFWAPCARITPLAFPSRLSHSVPLSSRCR